MNIKKIVRKAMELSGIYISREPTYPNVLSLLKRYGITCQSVLHIGGHYAEEADSYRRNGISRAIFIEGDPVIFEKMQKILGRYPSFQSIQALLSDKSERVIFHVASNDGASSSILTPARHLTERPDITFAESKFLDTVTLDSLNLPKFDVVILDVQGAEHRVIRGGLETLGRANAIWVEVNAGFMYDGDADSAKIVELLSANFVPLYMNMNSNKWGDALFIRRIHNLSENKSL